MRSTIGTVSLGDEITLRLRLTHPLTAAEQAELKTNLAEYFRDHGAFFGFKVEGKTLCLTPSPKTLKDAPGTAFVEVVRYLADPGVTVLAIAATQKESLPN